MRESIQVEGIAGGNQPGDVFDPNCPSRVLLDHVGPPLGACWSSFALSNGTMRWGEIRRWVKGVTEKMLAQDPCAPLEAERPGGAEEAYAPVVPPPAWTTA